MLIRSISAVFAVICLVASLRAEPPQLSYQPRLLALDANEGIAAGDVDGDGITDLVAGRSWFRGGDWAPRPLRRSTIGTAMSRAMGTTYSISMATVDST